MDTYIRFSFYQKNSGYVFTNLYFYEQSSPWHPMRRLAVNDDYIQFNIEPTRGCCGTYDISNVSFRERNILLSASQVVLNLLLSLPSVEARTFLCARDRAGGVIAPLLYNVHKLLHPNSRMSQKRIVREFVLGRSISTGNTLKFLSYSLVPLHKFVQLPVHFTDNAKMVFKFPDELQNVVGSTIVKFIYNTFLGVRRTVSPGLHSHMLGEVGFSIFQKREDEPEKCIYTLNLEEVGLWWKSITSAVEK